MISIYLRKHHTVSFVDDENCRGSACTAFITRCLLHIIGQYTAVLQASGVGRNLERLWLAVVANGSMIVITFEDRNESGGKIDIGR